MPTTEAQNLQKALTYTKTILDITDDDKDAVLSSLIKSASALINKKTGIDLLNVTSQTEYFSGAGQTQIFLSKSPIGTVTSISYNTNKRGTAVRVAYTADNYIVEDFGMVTFSSSIFRGTKNIKVIYTTGFTDFDAIPAKYEDLKLALSLVTGNMYNIRKQGGISSEGVSGTNLVYDKKAMTKDVDQLLDQYLDIAI